MNSKFSRSNFLKFIGFGFLALTGGISLKKLLFSKKEIEGKIHGADFNTGHLLRKALTNKPEIFEEIETLIIGGGMSGLSAGWWFSKNNYNSYKILEMENKPGGNSKGGENEISKFPWGAHYIPLPGINAKYVKELFEEFGIITGYKNEKPIYNDFYICSDPNERLYFQGRWHDGLIPNYGISEEDHEQYKSFFSHIKDLKNKKGNDSKIIFSIPMELSSQDSNYLKLDTISMFDYLNSNKWTSEYLHWYINYCCRDDYGASYKDVSAWAGLHYFCSRTGEGVNVEKGDVITWPEGNEWIVEKLKEKNINNLVTNQLVYKIKPIKNEKFLVNVYDIKKDKVTQYITNHIIYSAPRFTAKYTIEGYSKKHQLEYNPWLVANISLNNLPEGKGVPLSWDNVSYYSDSLGYIFANHQDLTYNRNKGVITYYLPLDSKAGKDIRKEIIKYRSEDWKKIVLDDLERLHPGISKDIIKIDFWVWGHGMISPGINYLWSKEREKMLESFNGIEFAHSDMSGISVFEEAQFRGCEAAKKILRKVKV
ncbi:MAG: NAD(P)/FAD-dependent oxidoreductase [Leptospiraceae bacterium]|nr:NAD(P)/FAD-dependent oxidoreductase [Leptospiraceae bacterium]